jgi:lipid-A-disaccharide synthase
MPRLLVSCGEPSGDLYAAELVRELLRRETSLEVFGLGGDRLAEQGARLLAHVRELAVVGLLEVVKHLSRLRAVFASVLDEVDRRPPDVAVLIDYPDFNLRLARELRRRGIPVVYYVSPQVWAWRRRRVHAIRRDVSLMLVIFPFEEAIYREAGVRVRFVGHPLVDLVRPPDRAAFLARHRLDPARRLVAVLPGSRRREVAHNLPPLAGAVERLSRARPELQFVAVSAPTLPPGTLEARLAPLGARVVSGEAHGALGSADLALVASGTATVEAALLGTPLVVVYRLAALTYVLGRPFVRVPHYAMVNLIAGRRLVPELIQGDFKPDRVAAEALALLEDPSRLSAVREGLAQVRDRLGPPGASARAAEGVIQVMREQKKLDTMQGFL